MKIIWAESALLSYEKVIEGILERWNFNIVLDFELLVNILLEKLMTNNKLCPKSSKKRDLRKCLISKQTSLIYQIHHNNIEILLFIDNRSNHNF